MRNKLLLLVKLYRYIRDNIMTRFKKNKVLPEEFAYKSAANHLYRIGLCLTDDQTIIAQRKWYNNPVMIFTVLLVFLVMKITTSLADERNEMLFIVLGDFAHFMGIRREYNLMLILVTLLAIFSLISSWNQTANRGEPSFLQIFQIISGSVSPMRCNLAKRKPVFKLVARMKMICRLVVFNNELIIRIFAFGTPFIVFLGNVSAINMVLFGIPHSVLVMFYGYYFCNILLYQIVYIYIICLYLKIKFNELHERIRYIIAKKQFYRIASILRSFNDIVFEINDYNTTFWSKFFLIFWLTFGSASVLIIYVTVFHSMNFMLKLLFTYVLVMYSTIFLLVLFMASSLNSKANDSIKFIFQLIIEFSSLNRKLFFRDLSIKLKVIIS